MGGEKTLPRAIIGVWNKKNRCGIKRLPSKEKVFQTIAEKKAIFGLASITCGRGGSKHGLIGSFVLLRALIKGRVLIWAA